MTDRNTPSIDESLVSTTTLDHARGLAQLALVFAGLVLFVGITTSQVYDAYTEWAEARELPVESRCWSPGASVSNCPSAGRRPAAAAAQFGVTRASHSRMKVSDDGQ